MSKISVSIEVRENDRPYSTAEVASVIVQRNILDPDRLESEVADTILDAQVQVDRALAVRAVARKAATVARELESGGD
jgi:hypothetical protein